MAQTLAVREPATRPPPEVSHLAMRNGVRCAGIHLIIDLYGCNPVRLRDEGHVEETLRRCTDAAGATLLHVHTHVFEENGGISGMAVLAESHISLHSWPEAQYAALDVFMCGDTDPDACIRILQEAFDADRVVVSELLRGKSI